VSAPTPVLEPVPRTMVAAQLRGDVGSGDVGLVEVPVPEPGPGEQLVKLLRTGICGSDVHFVFDGTAQTAYTPMILGHEPVGVVVGMGPGADGPTVGTRVSVVPLVTCMECHHCLAGRVVLCEQRMCIGADCEGAFAEYIAVPARNCLPVPDGLSDELAAVATDSVATAYHAVAFRGGVREGSRVVVWGTGGLGLSAVGIARTLGASRVVAVDARAEARQWALETGADEALEPDGALDRITAMGGMDVALEFVGKQVTAELAVRSLDHGGRAVVVGMGFEPLSAGRIMTFVLREREVVGSYGSEPHEIVTCLDLMASGRLVLPRVVGDVIPLADVLGGLSRVQAGRTGGSRIVVDVTTGGLS
jgi:D-arabinose 1-dehydrogenase-like Zn-dependent alcohol dehydrogenase